MKTHKTEEVVRKVTVLDKMVCDICGKEPKPGRSDWSMDSYDVAETVVRMKEGTAYPSGGSGIELAFDICCDCFRDKLIPWVESHGSKVTETEWDY